MRGTQSYWRSVFQPLHHYMGRAKTAVEREIAIKD